MKRIVGTLAVAVTAFLVYGIAVENGAVAYYVPITVVIAALVAAIHRFTRLTQGTLWALVTIAIGNLAGGVLLVDDAPLYEAVVLGPLRYDKVYHAVASGVAAWAFYELLERWAGRSGLHLVLAAFLMASGAGALVEMVEYIGSLVLENNSIGGYANNMGDLIANSSGALVGAVVAWRSRSDPIPRPPPPG